MECYALLQVLLKVLRYLLLVSMSCRVGGKRQSPYQRPACHVPAGGSANPIISASDGHLGLSQLLGTTAIHLASNFLLGKKIHIGALIASNGLVFLVSLT